MPFDAKPGEAAAAGGALPLWLAGGLFIGALALRLASFHIVVLDWDEYAFALAGRAVLEGHLPATQIFDNKPSGLVYLFALAEALFGQTPVMLRLLGLLASLATALILLWQSRRLRLPWSTGLAVAAGFQLAALVCGGWASMSELLACPLLAMAFGMALRQDGARPLALGAIFGLAAQISYLTVPICGLTALALAWRARDSARKKALGLLLLTGAGWLGGMLLVWLPQIAGGTFGAFLREQLLYHEAYRAPAPGVWGRFFAACWAIANPLAMAAVVLGVSRRGWLADRRRRGDMAVIGAGLLGACLAACASNRFYPHYFLLLLPALAWLVLLALSAADAKARRLGTFAVLGFAALALITDGQELRARLVGTNPVGADPMDLAAAGGTDFEPRAAALVDRVSRPGQRILIFNESPVLYFLAHRETASRYVFLSHYFGDDGPAMIQPEAYLAQSLATHPAAVVIGDLVPTRIDADDIVEAAGYHQVASLAEGDREIRIYVPGADPD